MFSALEIAELYECDLHMHDVPVIQQFLAERQGTDLHVISRVDTEPEPLLPWDVEDAWLFEEVRCASS